MMRVAIVIDTLKVGGAQKLVSDFALAAAAHGIQPTVVCLHQDIHPIISEFNQGRRSAIAEIPFSLLV